MLQVYGVYINAMLYMYVQWTFFIVSQVKPGMDLSRVTLPTFILEPRSFLDKLSDFYFHTDILSR